MISITEGGQLIMISGYLTHANLHSIALNLLAGESVCAVRVC